MVLQRVPSEKKEPFCLRRREIAMKIIYAPDYETLSRKAAQLIGAQVLYKPDSLLGLATGSSPVGAYRYLARWYASGDLDFAQARSVNLDEYCGLDAFHEQSYHYFMKQNLFNAVNFRASWLPDGCAKDLPGECERYEAVIAEHGPIDLQLLGIGHNGHIGFNEPSEQFVPQTHLVQLSQETIRANARFFANAGQVPKQAITMGIASILQAKKILLLAGEGKGEILRQALTGPVTQWIPASVLQLHPDVTVVTTSDVF